MSGGRAIGRSVPRVEDRPLVTGVARFTADLATDVPALHADFVRSPLAHARVVAVDVTAARAVPGVVAVYTAADFDDLRGASPIPVPEDLVRPLLAADVVRFSGEILAVVVATSAAVARDAVEAVVVDLEPLPVVASLERALAPEAPLLFPAYSSNAVLRTDRRPAAADTDLDTDSDIDDDGDGDAFADADLVVELDTWNQRLAVAPLEGNAIVAIPQASGLRVHVPTQAPHAVRDGLARLCGLDAAAVHLVTPWTGGGFGGKSTAEPEYGLVCRAALALGRPVRWQQDRTENLVGMHGRAQRQHVRVAARTDGALVRLHADLVADGGAYPGLNHFMAELTAQMVAGPYTFDDATATVTTVATNTAPPSGYRGAGRPEATSLVERVVDIVAAELGLDPADVRRRNLVPADAFPHRAPTGLVYDTGDYGRALDRALALVRYDARRVEQARRRAAGDRWLLGLGVSCYVEVTAPTRPSEFAEVAVHPDGRATVRVGTFGHGQGHRTTYAQIAADVLALPVDAIDVIDGDTALVARGVGTFGSRSVQVAGSAVHRACERVVDEARARAADRLEAAPADIVLDERGFSVVGVPGRVVTWAEVAAGDGLSAALDWERPAPTFPFGAHVAVVEVDRETGFVRLVEHVAVDDCGVVINPRLTDGQVHGGVAQGVAQALLEEVRHDEAGNVLTATLADYAMISAADLPSITLDRTVTPTPLNPLGAKGIGEAGTIGATPAVHNAVVDALGHLGVRHLEMPCTPERVWRAIQGERTDALAVHLRLPEAAPVTTRR